MKKMLALVRGISEKTTQKAIYLHTNNEESSRMFDHVSQWQQEYICVHSVKPWTGSHTNVFCKGYGTTY